MPNRTIAAAPGALLLALAVPAGAQAAELAPLKPCYVTASTPGGPQVEGVDLRATGFTANSKVDVAIDGAPVPELAGLQTDATGALGAAGQPPQAAAPFVAKGKKRFTITLTEQGNPANVATATARSVALGVRVRPRRARPSQRVTFRGAGFTEPKAVYAHYLFGGKVRATVRLAKRTGECGTFKIRSRQIPVGDPDIGRWTVQFDQSKRFRNPGSGKLNVFVRLNILVSRVFRPR